MLFGESIKSIIISNLVSALIIVTYAAYTWYVSFRYIEGLRAKGYLDAIHRINTAIAEFKERFGSDAEVVHQLRGVRQINRYLVRFHQQRSLKDWVEQIRHKRQLREDILLHRLDIRWKRYQNAYRELNWDDDD